MHTAPGRAHEVPRATDLPLVTEAVNQPPTDYQPVQAIDIARPANMPFEEPLPEMLPVDGRSRPDNALPTPESNVERLHAAMREVVPLLENDNPTEATQAASAYVERRAEALAASDTGHLIGKDAGGTDTFIGPDTQLSMATMGNEYHLDDPAAYAAAFPMIQAKYARLREVMPKDKAYLNAVIAGVNYGQAAYFQSSSGDSSARLANSFDIIDDDAVGGIKQGATSIADYKGRALCLERAAVAHNTATIYGVTSRLHAGHLVKTAADGTVTGEDHAFLTFYTIAGDEYIFDPTNPVVLRNTDGSVDTNPALYKRTPGAATQDVELKEYAAVGDQIVLTKMHKLTYTFDPTIK